MNRLLTRLGVPLVLVIMASLTAPPVYAQGSTTSTITAAGLSMPLLGSLSSLSIMPMVLTLSPK